MADLERTNRANRTKGTGLLVGLPPLAGGAEVGQVPVARRAARATPLRVPLAGPRATSIAASLVPFVAGLKESTWVSVEKSTGLEGCWGSRSP